jgi:hypothetical protein
MASCKALPYSPRRWAACIGRYLRAIVPVVVVSTAGAVACGSDSEPDATAPPNVGLVLVQSSGQVPFSAVPAFAVVGEDDACVLDSFNVEIVCGHRDWENPRTIAREGAGPGEIGLTGRLVSTPEAGVAYLDTRNRRATFFDANLDYERSAVLPPGPPGSEVLGDSTVFLFSQPAPATRPTLTASRVDLRDGAVLGALTIAFDPALVANDTATITGGLVTSDERLLVRIGAGGVSYMAWYSDDGQFLEMIDLPRLEGVYPTARDVEYYKADYRFIFRQPPPEAAVARYEATPLRLLPRGSVNRSLQVDSRGRVWVRSNRPSDVGSFLEVFAGREHLGSLELPGWIVAFQIKDSTLVALVDDMQADDSGLYPRRLDWYRIIEGPSIQDGPDEP